MFQRLTDRGDVDKEHIIELESGKAKLFFLKESKSDNALVRVKNCCLIPTSKESKIIKFMRLRTIAICVGLR